MKRDCWCKYSWCCFIFFSSSSKSSASAMSDFFLFQSRLHVPKVVVLHFRPACACTTHFPRNTKWSWEPLRPCTFTDTHHTILFWVQNPSLFSHWLGGFVTVVLKNPFQSSLPYSPAHCACLADVCVAGTKGSKCLVACPVDRRACPQHTCTHTPHEEHHLAHDQHGHHHIHRAISWSVFRHQISTSMLGRSRQSEPRALGISLTRAKIRPVKSFVTWSHTSSSPLIRRVR